MFENILGQSITQVLQHEIEQHTLAPALLFVGPESSGKLTTALELARILSCHTTAAWSCTCKSCLNQKGLTAPDVLIMGARNTLLDIKAAAHAFLNAQTTPTRYLFIRSVRKLTIRFDPRLWDPEETRFIKAIPILTTLEEAFVDFLAAYHLASKPEDAAKREKRITKIVDLCEKLQEECMYDTIPINQVRKAASWLHLVPTERKKILIIEHADKMQDSARNAFLKIIEEPPAYAHFILTTCQRRAVMPTILSRVRTYTFTDRKSVDQYAVIERIFRDTAYCAQHAQDTSVSVCSYLRRFLPVTAHAAKEAAALFWEYVFMRFNQVHKQPPLALFNAVNTYRRSSPAQPAESVQSLGAIVKLMHNGKPRQICTLFLEQCTSFLQISLRDTACTAHALELYAAYTAYIRQAQQSLETLHITLQATLEHLAEQITATDYKSA